MKIVLKENLKKAQPFWWVVVAANGNVLLTSETYEKKATRTKIANNFSKTTSIPVEAE